MRVEIHHPALPADTYRAALVASLYNTDTPESREFRLSAELPIEGDGWSIGAVVGPSGSGKSSLGRAIWGPRAVYKSAGWPRDLPIVEAIAPERTIDEVTGALAAVGLGAVPAWMRPYRLLSNGERFRADLARIVCDRLGRVVIDEFSSVVDRQIARIGALAFAKAWRRGPGQAVLLTCHYDVLDWLQPDWTFDTSTGRFAGRWLQRRPSFDVEIQETDWSWWSLFEPHHYLKAPKMVAAKCYVGFVAGEPVAHVAFSTRPGLREARACRLVIMPDWQGAGVGLRFLNTICARWLDGLNRFGKPMPTLFHTSHPGLAAALRAHRCWTQVSAVLHGGNKTKSAATIARAAARGGYSGIGSGYGGHFRAVQGFRYIGEHPCGS